MTAQPDPRIKEIADRIEAKRKFMAIPKCQMCGSQLRCCENKCICGDEQ